MVLNLAYELFVPESSAAAPQPQLMGMKTWQLMEYIIELWIEFGA